MLTETLYRAWLYKKTYRNWASVIKQVKSGKEKVFTILNDGTVMVLGRYVAMALPNYYVFSGVPSNAEDITASNWAEALLKLYGWTFEGDVLYKDFGGRRVTFQAYYRGEPAYEATIAEVFGVGIYDVDVSGKDVVDIGVGIGDSAIYFFMKGARSVVGVEPLPNVHDVSMVNLVNNIDIVGKVGIVNGAVAYGVKEVGVPEVPVLGSAGVRVGKKVKKAVKRVHAYTVKELAEGVNRDVIKIDCEGCEWDIFRHESDVVGEFDVVMVEFHGKGRKEIAKFLSQFREKYKYETVRQVEKMDTVVVMRKKR